jgi:hypothetical protein
MRCNEDSPVDSRLRSRKTDPEYKGGLKLTPREKVGRSTWLLPNSVLMAVAAVLSLAGIISRLQFQDIYFLTDNRLMAHFYNGPDHSDPPQ